MFRIIHPVRNPRSEGGNKGILRRISKMKISNRVHPNRWFFWAISLLLACGLILLFCIFETKRILEKEVEELAFPPSENLSSYFGWRIFRSEALGVSIKYPPSWELEFNPLEPNVISLQNPASFNENITLTVVKPALEKTIRDSLQVTGEREVVIDGRNGIWLISQDIADRALSNVVLIKEKDRLYTITGYAHTFEKVLSGIKFLEK